VQHALAVLAASAAGNFARLFSLYRSAPNMGAYIIEWTAHNTRISALMALSKSVKPTIPLSFLTRMLAFESQGDAARFLRRCGGVLIEKDVLPAGSSSSSATTTTTTTTTTTAAATTTSAAGATAAVAAAVGPPPPPEAAEEPPPLVSRAGFPGAAMEEIGIKVKREVAVGAGAAVGAPVASEGSPPTKEWHLDCKASEIVHVRQATAEEEEFACAGVNVLEQLRMATDAAAAAAIPGGKRPRSLL
jgi:hypothetical protein